MSDFSRPRFTVTLGRSGQVVNRDVSHGGAGNKRPVIDRLGNNADSSVFGGKELDYKRPRGETSTSSVGSHDMNVRKDDLRYKLLQKNVAKRAHSNHDKNVGDLHEQLSKAIPSLICSPDIQHYMPMSRETSVLSQMSKSREASVLSQMLPARTVSELTQIDSVRRSRSPWAFEHPGKSSEGLAGVSRNISSHRNMEELQRQPSFRTVDDVRLPLQYMGGHVVGPSTSGTSSPYMTTSMLPPVPAKPVATPLGQQPLASGLIQKSSYLVDDQQTVDGLLNALGLGKYAILFKAEEIDMTVLKQMGENDLKEIGVPMGPRKKILLALMPRHKHHQP